VQQAPRTSVRWISSPSWTWRLRFRRKRTTSTRMCAGHGPSCRSVRRSAVRHRQDTVAMRSAAVTKDQNDFAVARRRPQRGPSKSR